MLANLLIRNLSNTMRSSPHRLSNDGKRAMLSIGEHLSKKEKVEEDRFMRAQEEAWKEKLRRVRAEQEALNPPEDAYKRVMDPVKVNIVEILRASGDTISDQGLEALAKWKLGL